MNYISECLTEISFLLEGGNAFGGVRPIKKSEVRPTFEEFEKQVFKKIGVKGKGVMIGSAVPLVKEKFGDIDTALDDEDVSKMGGFEGLSAKLGSLKFPINTMPGLKLISVKFPIYDSKKKMTKSHAQIDIMVGKKVWLEFWSFTPTNSQYKTLYRNNLMQSLFRVLHGVIHKDPSKKYSMSHLGLRMKDIEQVPITKGKRKGEMKDRTLAVKDVTNTPKGMITVLNKLTNKKFKISDFNSFETLLTALKKNLKKNFFNLIVQDCKEHLERQGMIVPDEISE